MTTATENAKPAQAPAKGILVTEKALAKVRLAMAKEGVSPEQGGLRLGVQGGGCSGFQYHFDLDPKPVAEGETVLEKNGAAVIIDGMSLGFLAGSTLDYVEDLSSAGFAIKNPNATAKCGCGNSFSV